MFQREFAANTACRRNGGYVRATLLGPVSYFVLETRFHIRYRYIYTYVYACYIAFGEGRVNKRA